MEQQEEMYEGAGYRVHKHELRLGQLGMKWGTYTKLHWDMPWSIATRKKFNVLPGDLRK